MNKKRVLGLILFSCAVIGGMFLGTMLLIGKQPESDYNRNQPEIINEAITDDTDKAKDVRADEESRDMIDQIPDTSSVEPDTDEANDDIDDIDDIEDEADSEQTPSSETDQAVATPSPEPGEVADADEPVSTDIAEETDSNTEDVLPEGNTGSDVADTQNGEGSDSTDTLGGNVVDLPDMQLITNSSQVDYMQHIPDMILDNGIELALNIDNPSIDVKARSAILFDATTREVLYYKDPVIPVFPASTAKLLTALVALDWCMEEETVTAGDELRIIASDSTQAYIKKGQILTVRNLLEGMLIPSGNDAAYVIAAYVGRKSLKNENADLKEAIPEFIKMMNNKAKDLGAVNSSFKTPDGYDAIGQYTTAYDMGLIGMAAAYNETIVEICGKSRARNIFADGSDVTWNNSNSLVVKESGRYYPYCIGLKTGTSTMAGRCLISAAKKVDRVVVCVVMDSDASGRWEDSTALLKYGLEN